MAIIMLNLLTFLVMSILFRNYVAFITRLQYKSFSKLFATQSARRDGLGKPKGYAGDVLRYSPVAEARSGLPPPGQLFTVLGLESSCDDTGVAIVRSDGKILADVVLSQYDIHEKFGGIVPSLAMEAHKANINRAVAEALKQAKMRLEDISAIAATQGPGLEICLRVGFKKGQELARQFGKPFVSVHHLEAHCLIARLAGQQILANTGKQGEPSTNVVNRGPPKVDYPFLALLASGGHTSLLVCRGIGDYTVLGGTLDDSVGEAFDKAARLLGLQFSTSGGAAVEQAAKLHEAILEVPRQQPVFRQRRGANSTESSSVFNMRVPMRDKINCDLSFAGLKNSFRVAVQNARVGKSGKEQSNAPAGNMQATDPSQITALDAKHANQLCYHFQDVAFTHLEDRIDRALDFCEGQFFDGPDGNINITALVVVGGVAANLELRRRLLLLLEGRAAGPPPRSNKDVCKTPYPAVAARLPLVFPPPALCTDNGIMAAWAGVEKLLLGYSDSLDDKGDVISRWPLGELDATLSFKKK